MKRIAISIVLNGDHHLMSQAGRIPRAFDKWIIVEGASKNIFCTSWCKEMPSKYHNNGNSVDMTLGLLDNIKHNNPTKCEIIVIKAQGLWEGKLEMFNTALKHVQEPCWLWEIDIDEYWDKQQHEHAEAILINLGMDCAAFACDYLLSDDIIVRGSWGESIEHGYRRLWKYQPGMVFLSHEPPVLSEAKKICPPHYLPRFKHLSYYFEKEVEFKSKWYGNHENILYGWREIINGNTKLPCTIDQLFYNTIPDVWKKTIITYR